MLNPIRVRRQIDIRATPDEVWSLIRNPGAARWMLPKGAHLELLTDTFDEVGSRWRIVTIAGHKRMEVLNEVLSIEEPRSQVLRSTSDRMIGESRTTLTPTPDGTRLLMEGMAEFPSGLRSLPSRLLTAIVAPIATRNALKRMKRYIEDRTE